MKRNNQNFKNEFFDEYQRYQIVSDTVEFYRRSNPEIKYHVLEIGANKQKHLGKFLPADNILYTDITLDQEMQQDPEFMEVDGTSMPFANNSFDFVVATDVLEHVPKAKRKQLLEEASRVANYATIITFPYNSYENNAAETRINAYYKALKGEDYIWIQEHKKYGLPELEDVEHILNNIKCAYSRFLCGDIVLWEKLYYSFFSALDHYKEWEFRKQIDQFYFDVLYDGDWSDSCYRAVYIITHEKNGKLYDYLHSKRKYLSSKQINMLDMLLNAQNTIHAVDDDQNYSKRVSDMLQKCLEEMHYALKREESQKQELLSKLESFDADLKKYITRETLLEQELMNLRQRVNIECQQKIELYKQLESVKKTASELQKENAKLTEQLDATEKQYNAISQAFFWKISKPIRIILDFCKSFMKL